MIEDAFCNTDHPMVFKDINPNVTTDLHVWLSPEYAPVVEFHTCGLSIRRSGTDEVPDVELHVTPNTDERFFGEVCLTELEVLRLHAALGHWLQIQASIRAGDRRK